MSGVVWFVCGWQVKLCDPLCYTQAISERFRDKELIIKRYINAPSLLYFTLHVAINICINCSFVHLYLLFYHRFWVSSCSIAHLESTIIFVYLLYSFYGLQ